MDEKQQKTDALQVSEEKSTRPRIPFISEINRYRDLLFASVIMLGIIAYFTRGLFQKPLPLGGDALVWTTWQEFRAIKGWPTQSWFVSSWPGGPSQVSLLDVLLASLYSLWLSPDISNMALILTMFGAGISMFLYASHLLKSSRIAIIPALIYLVNRPVIDQLLLGHYTIVLGYALLPLLFLCSDLAMSSMKLRYSYGLGMALGFYVSAVNTYSVVLTLPIWGLYVLTRLFLSRGNGLSGLRRIATAVCVAALISAVTVIPSLLVTPAYITKFEDRSLLLASAYQWSSRSLIGAVTFLDLEGASYPSVGASFFLFVLPAVSYAALALRKRLLTLHFGALAISTTFLSLGPYFPDTGLYLALGNVPFFYFLRDPVRWSLVTVFAYSMLAGFSVQYFAKLKRTPRWLNWWSRCFPNLQLSNKLLATTLALLILVSGFLSMGIAYSHGMQSYQIPPGLAAAYTRISNDSDNFAVLTSPFTYNYVQNYPTADPWAQTWDFSYYSPVITGKPIWTPIVIDSQSSIFIQYLLHIIRSEQTLDFPKIIGSFGVKYVVLQGITPDITPTGWIFTADQERQFFSAQNGLVPVYSNGNQTVFRDNYYVPPVVASPNYTLVIGGLDALESMAGLANYTFNQNPLIFGSQNTGASFLNLIRNANVLLFQGTEATDLVMLALQSSGTANFISPVDSLANTDQALSWSPFFRPYVDGDYRISDAGVSTSSNSTISTHFSTSTQGQFEIWLHLFVGEDAEAGVALDGKTIALLTPSQLLQPANVGYRWLMVNSTELAPGNHDLSIRAILKDGASLSVDKIAILPTGIYEQEDSNIRTLLSGPNTYPMYVIPAGSYLYAPATQWRLTAFSYNLSSYLFDSSSRLVLSNTSSGFSGWITSTVDLVKSGTYRFMLSALSASQAEFVINIDGYNTTFQVPPSNDFVWSTGPPLQLQEGLHTLQVAVNDRASFDKIVLYPVGLNLSYTPASSSYSEESPTEYLVDIPRGTRVITLSQAYSNLWQASSEGTTLQHVVLSYVTNGFLPGSGTSGPVVIQFEGQQILDISSYITISGLLLPIPMTLYRKRLFNRRST